MPSSDALYSSSTITPLPSRGLAGAIAGGAVWGTGQLPAGGQAGSLGLTLGGAHPGGGEGGAGREMDGMTPEFRAPLGVLSLPALGAPASLSHVHFIRHWGAGKHQAGMSLLLNV